MKFGIVYEEYVCETVAKEKKMSQIEAAQQDMSYMESSSASFSPRCFLIIALAFGCIYYVYLCGFIYVS